MTSGQSEKQARIEYEIREIRAGAYADPLQKYDKIQRVSAELLRLSAETLSDKTARSCFEKLLPDCDGVRAFVSAEMLCCALPPPGIREGRVLKTGSGMGFVTVRNFDYSRSVRLALEREMKGTDRETLMKMRENLTYKTVVFLSVRSPEERKTHLPSNDNCAVKKILDAVSSFLPGGDSCGRTLIAEETLFTYKACPGMYVFVFPKGNMPGNWEKFLQNNFLSSIIEHKFTNSTEKLLKTNPETGLAFSLRSEARKLAEEGSGTVFRICREADEKERIRALIIHRQGLPEVRIHVYADCFCVRIPVMRNSQKESPFRRNNYSELSAYELEAALSSDVRLSREYLSGFGDFTLSYLHMYPEKAGNGADYPDADNHNTPPFTGAVLNVLGSPDPDRYAVYHSAAGGNEVPEGTYITVSKGRHNPCTSANLPALLSQREEL